MIEFDVTLFTTLAANWNEGSSLNDPSFESKTFIFLFTFQVHVPTIFKQSCQRHKG
jgi:hypothetical protein